MMDVLGFVALIAPGTALIIAGNVLMFSACDQEERQRNARIIVLGFTLITLIPGVAVVVLVVLGRMQAPALIAAGVLIGLALLRIFAIRVN